MKVRSGTVSVGRSGGDAADKAARKSFASLIRAGTSFRDETDRLLVLVPKAAINSWVRETFGGGAGLETTIQGMSKSQATIAARILKSVSPDLAKGSRDHALELVARIDAAQADRAG